jgi:16S rRNA (cytidine1402-2'-O)-methyltransferase
MLAVVSTPIGHPKDISLRALEVLQEAEVVIGEERREASTLLKKLNVPPKDLYLLNEHSTVADVRELVELCRHKKVALISDCGTPSFYDPGYQLVRECRRLNIPVTSIPGASSLMTLLSLVSEKVTQFYFAGFLPADNELRQQRFKQLMLMPDALVLMDTPYRLQKLLTELDAKTPRRHILLGLNLTQEQELVIEGTASELLQKLSAQKIEKAEFILLLYANGGVGAHTSPKSITSANTPRRRTDQQGSARRDSRHSSSPKKNAPPFRKG